MTLTSSIERQDVTVDAFLGHALQIRQPRIGYRAATDPVLLAAAITAKPGDAVLELGCGVGVASLCLLHRVAGLTGVGLELQEDYASLARQNARHNGLALDVMVGDLRNPPPAIKAQSFDHVFFNPPFFDAHASTAPTDPGRDQAHRETSGALAAFLQCGLRRLKPKGWLTVIHRVERLSEILTELSGPAGDIRILPLAARTLRPATRVIIRARKGSQAELSLLAPFILHQGTRHIADGDNFSPEASAVLREGAEILF